MSTSESCSADRQRQPSPTCRWISRPTSSVSSACPPRWSSSIGPPQTSSIACSAAESCSSTGIPPRASRSRCTPATRSSTSSQCSTSIAPPAPPAGDGQGAHRQEPRREERFVEHTLQIAIQAALDVASHIVSDERLGEPRTNRELVDLLERNGWIAPDLAVPLRRMVGFRNILVHGYETVDVAVVREVVEHRLDDLLRFAHVIRSRLA